MLSNFCAFEELVFFDLWISDIWVPISGSWFLITDSGFRVLGLPFNHGNSCVSLAIF